MAASYIELERLEEANIEAMEALRMNPDLSVVDWRQRLPYKDKEVLERIIDSLGRMGVK